MGHKEEKQWICRICGKKYNASHKLNAVNPTENREDQDKEKTTRMDKTNPTTRTQEQKTQRGLQLLGNYNPYRE